MRNVFFFGIAPQEGKFERHMDISDHARLWVDKERGVEGYEIDLSGIPSTIKKIVVYNEW